MSKVLEKIGILVKVGDLAVKPAPESVGLAWMGISLILGALQDDFQTLQVLGSACADIVGIMVTSRLLARMFARTKGPSELEEIQDQVRIEAPKVYGKILEFSYQVWKYVAEHPGKRILLSLLRKNKDAMLERIEDVKNADQKLQRCASDATQALLRYGQEDMKADLDEIKNLLASSMAHTNEWNKQMNDLRGENNYLKKRTPSEIAREAFDRQLKQLDCKYTQEILQEMQKAKLRQRKPGTCQWIFMTPGFTNWSRSQDSEFALVLGSGNMGKSILVSSVIDSLQADKDAITIIFFCRKTEDNAQKTELICKNILFTLYQHVELDSIDVLDRCNEAMRGYLTGITAGRRVDSSKDEDRGTSFETAFRKIVAALQKQVYLVIDALDECTDREQFGLIDRLRRLSLTERNMKTELSAAKISDNHRSTTRDPPIKIFASCREEEDIKKSIRHENSRIIHTIDMRAYVEEDLANILSAKLDDIPDLSNDERRLAHSKIVEKADCTIGYINGAMELFGKPWQRPLANHLQTLPGDLL